MSLEVVTRTIQFILAPVVMVSTCAIVLGSLLSRYAFLNDRLRALSQEHRALALAGAHAGAEPPGPAALPSLPAQRLQEIEAQLPNLVRRHALLRKSVLSVNYATIVFFLDMFVIAVAAQGSVVTWLGELALLVFLAGTGLTAFGILLSTLELRTSQFAVAYDLTWFSAPGSE